MTAQHRGDDELSDLLSALLDGELDADEESAVRAYLDRSDAAGQDLASLSGVRTVLRDLPAVDPPFGFYDRMVLDHHPSRRTSSGATRRAPRRSARGSTRSWPRLVAAVVAAAAMIVLIVGVTPAADSVVPPVQAFAARHESMAAPASPAITAITAPVALTAPVPAGSAVPPRSAASGSGGANLMSFEAMPATALDQMAEPYAAPPSVGAGSMPRLSGYHSASGVVHVMYGTGQMMVSLYEQQGIVEWSKLPSGTPMTIGDDAAWTTTSSSSEVIVLGRGRIVYTVVSSAPHDMTMTVVSQLPRPSDGSITDRVQAACRSIVDRFSFAG